MGGLRRTHNTQHTMTVFETGTIQFLGSLGRRWETLALNSLWVVWAADGRSTRGEKDEAPRVMSDDEWLMVWCGLEEERDRI